VYSISSQSEEHQGIMWALVFFLLEHAEDTPPDAEAPAVLELVLSLVTSQNLSYGLHQMLLQVRYLWRLNERLHDTYTYIRLDRVLRGSWQRRA